jgi:hypothetical protein
MGAVAAEPDVEVRVLICFGRRGNSSEFSGYRGGRGGGGGFGTRRWVVRRCVEPEGWRWTRFRGRGRW